MLSTAATSTSCCSPWSRSWRSDNGGWAAGRAGLWAALTFGTLALVVDVAPLLHETPDRPIETFRADTLVALLVLFPYLLYRFDGLPAADAPLEQLLGLMTLIVLVWTFACRRSQRKDEPRSTGFVVYVVAFLFHWTALSVVVAVRLWRGARAATVARRRLQVLAGASAAITAALLAAGAPNEDSAAALASHAARHRERPRVPARPGAAAMLRSPGGGRRTHVCRRRSRA